MSDPIDRDHAAEHLLETIPTVTCDQVGALKSHWLLTAEQVLAASASPGGRGGLQALLGLDDAGLAGFLEGLASAVGPEAAATLRRPAQGGAMGARLTEQQQKRFGLR